MPNPIGLSTIAEGAVEEVWQAEVERVLANIDDQNTDWKAKRTITLVFEFVPDEERRIAALGIRASSKLAGIKGRATLVYLGRQGGKLIAVEAAHQEDLFAAAPRRPEIVPTPEPAVGEEG